MSRELFSFKSQNNPTQNYQHVNLSMDGPAIVRKVDLNVYESEGGILSLNSASIVDL